MTKVTQKRIKQVKARVSVKTGETYAARAWLGTMFGVEDLDVPEYFRSIFESKMHQGRLGYVTG